jgi:phenylacetate-coenzyme A ligase PaaK-like adenylate-forming protein
MDETRKFDPEVLAATAVQLRRIALSRPAARVRNSVVVLTYEGELGLAEHDRDLFWDVFGVPAFELYLSRGNRLIASECDAHEGLHVRGPLWRREGWRLDTSPCQCGDKRPRLVAAPDPVAPNLRLCVEQP